MMKLTLPRGAKLLFAATLAAAIAHAGPVARPTECDWLKKFPAGRLTALVAGGEPDAKGFVGGNHSEGHWIEAGMQRGCCWHLIGAVVAGDAARAENAWRSIDTAFAHQVADGGFDSTAKPDAGPISPLAGRVQTAFFHLQELSHAILVHHDAPALEMADKVFAWSQSHKK